MSHIDTEIERVEAALKRSGEKIAEMNNYWSDNKLPCCPGCAFGTEYTEACDKAERQAQWLVVLLRRRNKPDDPRRIRNLSMHYIEAHKMVQHLDDLHRKKELSKMNKEPHARTSE